MTLIVAKKIAEKSIHIVSDTKITNPHSVNRRNFLVGALKSIILSPTRCLCFAGKLNIGLDAVEEVYKSNLYKSNILDLLNYLVAVNEKSLGYTDFLLCELREKSKIYTIKDYKFSEEKSAWIGDKSVFEYFQHSFHQHYHWISEDNVPEKMFQSMMRIVHSDLYPKNNSVGDHIIVTQTTREGFRYLSYNIGFPVAIPNGEKSVKNDAKNGGYSESIYVPKKAGVGAIAVHIFPGNLGLLYCPFLSKEVISEKNVQSSTFSKRLREIVGIEFTGIDNNYITTSKYY